MNKKKSSSKGKNLIILLLLFGSVYIASKEFLGHHHFYKYQKIKTKEQGVDNRFIDLENSLVKAIRIKKDVLFYRELALIYIEQANRHSESGAIELKNKYCNLALEALNEEINWFSFDPLAYYNLGSIYMLYSYPLTFYFDKAKLYFRQALEIRPADEDMTVNILSIYFKEWDYLEIKDREFVYSQLKRKWNSITHFTRRLKNTWTSNQGNIEKLKEILSGDSDVLRIFNKYL